MTAPWSKGAVFVVLTICGFCLVLFYKTDNLAGYQLLMTTKGYYLNSTNSSKKFLVQTSKCRIPDLDPFTSTAREFYHPEKYFPCRKLDLLTYVTKTNNTATLHIDEELVPSYTKNNITCCYSNVTRQTKKDNPDDNIKISKCREFSSNVTISEKFIMVRCKDSAKKEIYENTHAIVTATPEVERKIEEHNWGISPISVLFIGIDSISRLNLIRSLPATYNFAQKENWISLKGYNKVADNTFPNLMAILTGFNESHAYSVCNPRSIDKLDNCPLLWYDFQKLGYVTAYAEDEGWINTFNYHKKGFTKQPTDFYFRPYILASEKLKTVRKDEMTYCTGPETSGERILNIAKDFAITFKNYPTFGFFWMNTFSHNDINSPSGMDKKIRNFLEDIKSSGVLENTILIFLSDHGIRFGEIRYTRTGWLEERLPFIYLSIPETVQKLFPQNFENLQNSVEKLTNPYDLHMTLQHILVMSGFNYTMKPGEACPNCQSLFTKIPNERSCEDISIEQHWCTCAGYTPISASNKTVTKAVSHIIGQIHEIIRKKRGDHKCAKYSLRSVLTASISEQFEYKNDTYFLLVFETRPKAVFEATIQYGANDNNFQLQGGISRLDRYSAHSKCVDDAYLKKYCYCR